jgi:hypothetical protein
MNKPNLICLVNISLLILSVCFGTFALYVHNNLLPYIFFFFAVCVIIAPRRITELDEALVISAWVILALFPVPFLLYYQDVILMLIYVVLFWAWFIVNENTDCTKCDNEWCGIIKIKGQKPA